MPKLLRARAPEDVEEERKIGKLAGSRHARSEHDAGHDGQNGQDRQPAHDQHGTDGSSWVRRVHVPVP